jgi:hypothetical protein
MTPPDGLVLLMASKFLAVRFSQALRAALPIYCVFFPKVVAQTVLKLQKAGGVAARW